MSEKKISARSDIGQTVGKASSSAVSVKVDKPVNVIRVDSEKHFFLARTRRTHITLFSPRVNCMFMSQYHSTLLNK